LTGQTLGTFVDRQAARFGDRQAVAAQNGSLTYTELAREADRVAAALIAAGVSKGVRVGLLMPNWAQWLPVAFGVFKTGAWLVGLNTLSRASELEYQLRHTDVSVLIGASRFLRNDYVAMLQSFAAEAFHGERAPRCPQLTCIVLLGDEGVDGATVWPEFLAAGSAVTRGAREAVQQTVDAVDPAAVFFTSGSTATPKAAVLSHRALLHNAFAIPEHLGIEPDDRTWTTLPLFFSGGFCLCALSTLASGGAVVLNEAFEPAAALERLESERCTVMVGWNHVPLLLEHADFPRRKLALRKGVGGNLPIADRFLGAGHRAVGNYGMTETATVCCSARHDDRAEVR
jgi:fatty-acyl-CoA synthase